VVIMLVVYGGLIALAGWQFSRAPTGFIPLLDQCYLITVIQLPPGSSLSRTDEVVRRAAKTILEIKGVAHVVPFAGFDGATFTNAPNAGAIFVVLDPFRDRAAKGITTASIMGQLGAKLGAIQDAFIITIPPPPVRGIGNAGGFKMMVQDRRGRGLDALAAATDDIVGAANKTPGLAGVFTRYVEHEKLQPTAPYDAFIAVIERDARDSQAAIQLVLAQPSISSQIVDNLNASIHLRALLTDLFLIDEVLKAPR